MGATDDYKDLKTATGAATLKTTPVNADRLNLFDSTSSWAFKALTWANLKATLKTYTDTLYNNYTLETHASNHTDGTDDIQNATADQKGLATAAQITKLDGIAVGATADQDLSGYALKSNVLELDNTATFTPDADYEPATKKYVDDNAGAGSALTVKEEGTSLDTAVTSINFIGSGITAVENADHEIDVTVDDQDLSSFIDGGTASSLYTSAQQIIGGSSDSF